MLESGLSASTLHAAVRVLSPALCSAGGDDAEEFVDGLIEGIPQGSLRALHSDTELTRPAADDVVVTFVPSGEASVWRSSVVRHLNSARQTGADIIPVALHQGLRPPDPVTDLAPLSVREIMKSYHLGRNQYQAAGRIAARIALSRLWPTYSRERMRLFFSHRQSDGGDLVRQLSAAIQQLNQRPARDLADIRPGTKVTARLAEELDESDVFILCDTPDAAQHQEWLNDELCVALGLGLPIVWIRFGQRDTVSALRFRPGDKPDLDLDWPRKKDYISIAAKLIELAFLAGRGQVRRIEACIARAAETAQVEVLDGRRRILMLTRPRPFGPFDISERILVQAFARRPTHRDGVALTNWLKAHQLISSDGRFQSFDIGLLMGPAPVCDRGVGGASSPVTEAAGMFYTHAATVSTALSQQADRQSRDHPELLLFAALGPGSGARQEFLDAIQDVATHWLGRSGRLRFGGHPTVTPTVHWVARSLAPGHERERVTVFQSRYFVTPELLREIAEIAEVVGTDLVGGPTDGESRRASLTRMRAQMINTSPAVAAVVIGGTTSEERRGPPGVEEEFQLARSRSIPTFCLGATGGQAAVIAERARHDHQSFSSLGNSLSVEENEYVATTDDYGQAIAMIWEATVGKR